MIKVSIGSAAHRLVPDVLDKSVNDEYDQQQNALNSNGGIEPVFAPGEADFETTAAPFEMKANDRQDIEHYRQHEADDNELRLMKSKKVEGGLQKRRGDIIVHCF